MEEDDIKEGWRSYFDQLMDVENERIQREVPAREEEEFGLYLEKRRREKR